MDRLSSGAWQYPEHHLRRLEVLAPPRDPVDPWSLEVISQGKHESEVIPRRQGTVPSVLGTIGQDSRRIGQDFPVDDDPGLGDLGIDGLIAVVDHGELDAQFFGVPLLEDGVVQGDGCPESSLVVCRR